MRLRSGARIASFNSSCNASLMLMSLPSLPRTARFRRRLQEDIDDGAILVFSQPMQFGYATANSEPGRQSVSDRES